MLIKIFLGVAVVMVVLLIVVAMQSSEFRIKRTVRMSAPPHIAFAHVNDLHKWEAWSPWARLDPQMKQVYEGEPAGTGASYTWNGNNQVGEGRTTIVESRPAELVRLKLEFVRPFACTNDVAFTFEPEGEQTAVTWSMTGKKNFMAKAVHLCMNMDKMCGGQFEQGLASLKSIAEAESKESRDHAVALDGTVR